MTYTPIVTRARTAVVRLRILDPKTQTILWAFYERPEEANLARTYGKNVDKAIARLVSKLKSLAETPSGNTPEGSGSTGAYHSKFLILAREGASLCYRAFSSAMAKVRLSEPRLHFCYACDAR